MPGTVNAKTVRAVLGAAKALGLDAGALASTWGVADALHDVDARFPHTAWLGLWQDVIRATGSDSIGIDAARRLPYGHFDVIDYLFGTAENLGAALRRFERYFAIVSTGVKHFLEVDGATARLVRRYAEGCHTHLLAPPEFAFAAIVSRARSTLGFHWCPVEVCFASPPPANTTTQREYFGCPVRFETTLSAIVMNTAMLELPMPQPDAELSRILERHAEQLVGQLTDDDDIASRVRRIIVDSLPDAELSVTLAARKLGMSPRTLQRRLRECGETFDELYDRTRSDLARRYLGDPRLSIQETAHLLAFGDLRGFYRAFRRWEDCTPAEYRKRAVAA